MKCGQLRQRNAAKIVFSLSNGGFTLIELLVSVIIIGVLASIALPSYLNQAAKARASEAKAVLGAINRVQQSYRWERGVFSDDIAKLDLKMNGKFYSYAIASGNAIDTVARATTQQEGLRVSSAAVTINSSAFNQVLCESQNTVILNTSAILPTGGSGTPLGCPGGYKQIE
jgi:type IV pilus assembly protein PilA